MIETVVSTSYEPAAARRALELYLRRPCLETRNTVIEINTGLVRWVTAKVKMIPFEERDAYLADGILGMIKALERYDPGKGGSFSTYAIFWIRQEVVRAWERNHLTIYLPPEVYEKFQAIKKVRQALANRLGREPSTEEVAESMGETPESLGDFLETVELAQTDSLDRIITNNGDDGISLADWKLVDPTSDVSTQFEERQRAEQLKTVARSCLGAREYQVLMERVCEEQTLKEIADRLGFSREGVRRIEERALRKVRQTLGVEPSDPTDQPRRFRSASAAFREYRSSQQPWRKGTKPGDGSTRLTASLIRSAVILWWLMPKDSWVQLNVRGACQALGIEPANKINSSSEQLRQQAVIRLDKQTRAQSRGNGHFRYAGHHQKQTLRLLPGILPDGFEFILGQEYNLEEVVGLITQPRPIEYAQVVAPTE